MHKNIPSHSGGSPNTWLQTLTSQSYAYQVASIAAFMLSK